MIGLTFSGGGTRAAAFSYGVLNEIRTHASPDAQGPGVAARSRRLRVRRVRRLGAGRLLRAEEARGARRLPREVPAAQCGGGARRPSVNIVNISRARRRHQRLQQVLALARRQPVRRRDLRRYLRGSARPRIWINASDIYNRTPFVFGEARSSRCAAICSSYPVADAVAASAAVPVVFAPVVIETYPGKCPRQAAGMGRARAPTIRSAADAEAFADALLRYHDGVDEIRQAARRRPGRQFRPLGLHHRAAVVRIRRYGPLSPQQAVKLRRVIFLVVDCRPRGRPATGPRRVDGPTGIDLIMAAADTATGCQRRRRASPPSTHDEGLAGAADQLALRPVGSRAAAWARRRLELPRPEGLRQPRRLRPARAGARGRSSMRSRRASSCRRTRSTC